MAPTIMKIINGSEGLIWTLRLNIMLTFHKTKINLYPIIGEKKDDSVAKPIPIVRHFDLTSDGKSSFASNETVP